MKNKILILGVLALVLGSVSVLANNAEAYKGDPKIKGLNYSVERHDAMTKAFADKDYSTWSNLMQGKGRVTQVVNKDNFAKFAEAHNLALQGKTMEAQKIRQEIGLGRKDGSGKGQMIGGRAERGGCLLNK